MHKLTLSEPVNLGKTLGVLPAGEWLMHDLNAFEIARLAPRGAAQVKHYIPRDHPMGSVLIMRSGAIGDLLLLTPAIREFVSQGGERPVLSCFNHHHDIFSGNNDIAAVASYPIRLGAADGYQNIISLENTMESDHTQHATDVFAKALGLTTPLADYRPVYHVTPEERAATAKHLFANRPTLVIQPKASVANRDYPLNQWMEVIRKLEQHGWGVLIFGQKGQFPEIPKEWANPFVRDLSRSGLSFRECAAILSQAQAFCGVDSAWAHMCHALDIPGVVLFAAFDWRNRTGRAPKTIAITGVGECAPCNWHMHAGRQFPPGKPCTASQHCVVLGGIKPDRIVQTVSLLKP